jgi:DNA-binding NtrC family response regulator
VSRDRVLLVDDDPTIRFGVADFLASRGYEVEAVASCDEALGAFRACRPDVAVLDYSLGDGTALDLLPRLQLVDPTVPLLILTAHGSIDLAVEAIKLGAEQFLTKPIELPALAAILERITEHQRQRKREAARRATAARDEIDPFFGTSACIRRLAAEAERVAAADSPVLVQGETGTGKGVLARWLHGRSGRAAEAFVDLNCAGLSRELLETELFGHEKGAFTGAIARKPGLLEVAHRGTLFLDEIGDLDLGVQPKLLKVLEEKQFRRLGEVRGRLVREGAFRGDLYFRIATVPLTVPPLRERAGDLAALAERLLGRVGQELGRGEVRLSPAAQRALATYSWPGNIRELRNVLERAALLAAGDLLGPADLRLEGSWALPDAPDSGLTLEAVQRCHIERVLRAEGGHVTRAAARLGLPRSTLYEKLKSYGIAIRGDS